MQGFGRSKPRGKEKEAGSIDEGCKKLNREEQSGLQAEQAASMNL